MFNSVTRAGVMPSKEKGSVLGMTVGDGMIVGMIGYMYDMCEQ